MKIKSMASDKWYVVGTLSVNTEGVDTRWGGRKFVHVQSTEQMPGWEPRAYGSSMTFKVKGKVWDALSEFVLDSVTTPTLPLRETGMPYIQIGIEACGTHFQVVGVPEGNRWYGFAFDAK